MTIELVPIEEAKGKRANGVGRSSPNLFPYLPEPTGRMRLSAMWNPCYVCACRLFLPIPWLLPSHRLLLRLSCPRVGCCHLIGCFLGAERMLGPCALPEGHSVLPVHRRCVGRGMWEPALSPRGPSHCTVVCNTVQECAAQKAGSKDIVYGRRM